MGNVPEEMFIKAIELKVITRRNETRRNKGVTETVTPFTYSP